MPACLVVAGCTGVHGVWGAGQCMMVTCLSPWAVRAMALASCSSTLAFSSSPLSRERCILVTWASYISHRDSNSACQAKHGVERHVTSLQAACTILAQHLSRTGGMQCHMLLAQAAYSMYVSLPDTSRIQESHCNADVHCCSSNTVTQVAADSLA